MNAVRHYWQLCVDAGEGNIAALLELIILVRFLIGVIIISAITLVPNGEAKLILCASVVLVGALAWAIVSEVERTTMLDLRGIALAYIERLERGPITGESLERIVESVAPHPPHTLGPHCESEEFTKAYASWTITSEQNALLTLCLLDAGGLVTMQLDENGAVASVGVSWALRRAYVKRSEHGVRRFITDTMRKYVVQGLLRYRERTERSGSPATAT